MKTILIMMVILISGCTEPPVDLDRIKAGELRYKIFKECMSLASGNSRVGDDDVSDIVESCDDVAYYTAKQMLDY